MKSARLLTAAAVALWLTTACTTGATRQAHERPLREATDSARAVEKLVRLEDVRSRAPHAWPGFDLDSQVIITSLRPVGPVFLIGDPAPPPGFVRVRPGRSIFVKPMLPPDSLSGLRLAMDWNGRARSATAMSAEGELLKYLTNALVHEAFHTFQEQRRDVSPAEFRQHSDPEFPAGDVEAIALLNLEGRYLGDALRATSNDASRALAVRALAIREYRCGRLTIEECDSERGIEHTEGSADYVAAAVTGESFGYGPAPIWRDSLARTISAVRDPERLKRWHFYSTGYVWINLVERFSSGPGWHARVSLSPPDKVLREMLGGSRAPSRAASVTMTDDSLWPAAYSAAAEFVRTERARADSADRAFNERPGIPVRVYFGRVQRMSTEQGRTPDGVVQRRITFDGSEVVFRGPSRQICCPAGEVTIAEVRGAKAEADGREVRLDQPGRAAGALRLDLGTVAIRLAHGEIHIFADSIAISSTAVR